MSETLLVLDGHSLAYRAFFALPTTLTTASGQVTNAVYGFTSMLIKLLGEQRTDRVCVVFDVGRPTIRLAEYAEYKAQRAETPGEFRGQVDLLREVLDALRVPMYGVPDHEADDVAATIARRGADEGLDVVLVTADRDYLQLVRPGVRVLFNRKGVSDYVLYDEASVEERFGLRPEKLIDFVALKGDPSDNLPGVAGVGDKTAAQLVQQFGSVEAMLDRLDELPKRIQRLAPALAEARAQILLNKRLARLDQDVEIECDPAAIRMGEWDEDEIRRVFLALEFRSLLDRLIEVRPMLRPVEAGASVTVRSGAGALTETPGRRLAVVPGRDGGVAIASGVDEIAWIADPLEVRAVLEDATVPKVAHDAKSLAVRLARAGVGLAGVVFDTQIAAYLLDPAPGRYDLADISERYLNRTLPTARAPEEDGQLALGLEDGSSEAPDAASAAAAALVPLTERLSELLERAGMTRLLEEVELPLVEVLVELERVGVGIDADLLQRRSAELGARVEELESHIYEVAGGPFNLNSPPQLRTVLYDTLGLKPSRKTKTGYSTDAQALEGLRGAHPVVDALLEYRELSKLRSTYLDALPKLVDGGTGRVHATFQQTATATGRISTANPNLQNIPIRTELGREIRRAFVAAPPDGVLLVADYSQIELRVLAHITGDAGLTEAFARDEDIHAATAARIWKFPVDEVPRDLRNRAKAINFGLAYGMNQYGLAQRLGITPDEAQGFIDAYFQTFPGIGAFMRRVVQDAYRDGYTSTILGRRRYIPELEHSNPRVRALGERQALNAPIQGSAADLIKLAMIRAHQALREEPELRARMVLTVHDELVFECPESHVPRTEVLVRSAMEGAYPLSVPLKVDVGIGRNWADAKA